METVILFKSLIYTGLDYNRNSFSGKYRDAENVIRDNLINNLELDTVAYNSFIKAMLDAGWHIYFFIVYLLFIRRTK